jgi:phenylpropionate dioxygenase-like ring-hydroxylating dioxygenase large terminal subunit
MTSAAQNELMTRVEGAATAGKLLRQYWQPVALSDELNSTRPVRRVRVFGQDLVLFRGEGGQLGLLDRHCPHRGADLAFGRAEHGGIRCAFHGWLFATDGRCLETPAEPAGSALCTRVQQRSYPVVERSGIIFAYLGEGEPPAFPAFDCFAAPEAYTFAFKGFLDCNWLQALEVGIDPAHASYLHRFFEDADPAASYGKQFRGQSDNSSLPITKVLREYDRPEIRVEHTDYGMRLFALRKLDDAHTHIRVTNLVFPQAFVIPMSPSITISQWHVPIDDYRTYWYAIFTSFDKPVDKAEMRAQRLELYTLPDYIPRRNKANDYGFNAEEQQRATYTGMGHDINVHDQWAVESQGQIQDRTREHLGTTDKGIVMYRTMLLKALANAGKGEPVPMRPTATEAARWQGPIAIDAIGPTQGWEQFWQSCDRKRRSSSAWAGASPE